MDKFEFCKSSNKVARFIVQYNENLADENVLSNVTPGYLEELVEDECPKKGVNFDKIFHEFEEKIMPGITHWNSPHFHAYFPAGFSYASLLSELLIAGLNIVDVNWEAGPASVELETVVLNWLGKMMNLPEEFLSSNKGFGGGVLQTTSGEVTLLSLVAARKGALKKWQLLKPSMSESEICSKLIAYGSNQAHFSVERAGLLAGIQMKLLPCDPNGALRGSTLQTEIENDLNQGHFPCYVVGTLGTTTICSFDSIEELGPICKEYGLWLHVDAAYAGSALVCPEFRYFANGLEYAESFAVGLHKWMFMSYDVVAYWLKHRKYLEDALSVDRIYFKHKHWGKSEDFINMQIGTGRKFRSLKVWMVLKNIGLDGCQELIRRSVKLGKEMEKLISGDGRFVVVTSLFGVVTFGLKLGNQATEDLRALINEKKKIMLTPAKFNGRYLIRFVVNYSTREKDIEFAWKEVKRCADILKNDLIINNQ